MNEQSLKYKGMGYAMLRIAIGANLIGHGLVRITKLSAFRAWMVETFAQSPLPEWSVYAWGSVLPFIELLVGTMLVLGILTAPASLLGGVVMIALILGSCLIEQWEWVSVQMINVLVFYALISKNHYNAWALDKLRS